LDPDASIGSSSGGASRARSAMMNARYFTKLLKKQNSEPNGELGVPSSTTPRGSSNSSLQSSANAGGHEEGKDGRYSSNAVICARCKNEVVKQNGEWVEKRPLSHSNSSNHPGGNRDSSAGGGAAGSLSVPEVKKSTGAGLFFSSASSALSSVFSITDDRGGLPYVGSIHFTLAYDFTGQVLTVGVIEAKGLTAKDRGGTSDPYVKVLLLPEKKRRQETKVIFKNLSPTWNENLTFSGVPLDKLQKRILQLMVLDYDKFSRDDPIGEVNIPMCELDFTQPINLWKDLNPIAKEKYKRGEILLSLCYNPVGGIMTIIVVRCKELKPMDISGTSDPYVKVYHLYQGKRVAKHKTQCRMQSLNPVFDETFSFTVPTTKLEDTQLAVVVMDKDMIKWNEKIGSVILGKRSGQKEMQHWQDMLKSRRTPVVMWHYLRADLD
ncbi:synaptotagmin-7-like, partial [Convolutriloba macropyga]|uniref:synaptotagmin-7-like n=1 Tax=Convolutriloba macropyga TaxID=536237 RepID=UPI003F521087